MQLSNLAGNKKMSFAWILGLMGSFALVSYLFWLPSNNESVGWKSVNEEMGGMLRQITEQAAKTHDYDEKPADKPVDKPSQSQPKVVKASSKINLNQATAEQLTELPGIGEVKAKAIVEYREKIGTFQTTEDLMKVKGIGFKTYENLKQAIEVSINR